MTHDKEKSKEQLLKEIEEMRLRMEELEALEVKHEQTENALLENERFLSDVFDSIQDGINILGKDLVTHRVNRVMEKWYKENLPLVGKKCYEAYHNADKPCDPCPSVRCFKSGKTEREIVPGLPGSNIEYIELYSFPIKDRETGEVTGAVEFVRNITDRKRAEMELQKAHDQLEQRVKERTTELLSANENLKREINQRKRAEKERLKLEDKLLQARKMESIGTLAGGIAHDFNNILGAIIGYSELVMDDIPDNTIAKQNIGQVLTSAFRARELVKQILAFSRKSDKIRKPVLLSRVVEEALPLLRSTIPSTIKIQSFMEKKLTPLMANSTELHQVVINLCANAAHAMAVSGGVLEIVLKEIDIDNDIVTQKNLEPGRYQQLIVSDTGHGIDPDTIDRIFEPYFTTKKHGEGTGMGLAVVHGIVKSCNGDISVYSEPGKGTVFHVFLPVAEAERPSGITWPEPEKRGDERILFVDDEEMLVNMGEQVLTKLGYKVDARTNSIEALELFRMSPENFDLVITDQTMPDMTGMQLAEEVKRIRPDIPVILCTGFSQTIDEKTVKDKGIDAFLMKPINKKDIAHIIREVLAHKH